MNAILKCSSLLFFACLVLGGCASPNYYANAPKVDTSPAAIMAAAPCTPLLPDPNLSPNLRTGWSKAAPAGMEPLTCGGKTTPFYCSPSGCGDLDVKALPSESQRGQTWHGVVDVLAGKITMCVQPALYFGVGSVPCETKVCEASAGKSVRCVAQYQVTTDRGNATALNLHIVAAPGGVILGQAGFAEVPAWGG